MIRVSLPYPVRILWPNGRGNHHSKASATRNHRKWANYAVMEEGSNWRAFSHDGESLIPVHIAVYARASGPLPDPTNVGHAAKAYLDGIADRLEVNDKFFAAPTVSFGRPRDGRFIITIGEAPCLNPPQ